MKERKRTILLLLASVFPFLVALYFVLGNNTVPGGVSINRIVQQGYFYPRSESLLEFGQVTVEVYPSALRSNDSANQEYYDSPYTLGIEVRSLPSDLSGYFSGKEVKTRYVTSIRVRSKSNDFLYAGAGGQFIELGGSSFSWVSGRNDLAFEAQAIKVDFTLVLVVDGLRLQEAVSVEFPEPQYVESRSRDFAPPW